MADTARPLTIAERKLVASMFGNAIDYDAVKLHKRKWYPLQPVNTLMAPTGGIWFHPKGPYWRDDFGTESFLQFREQTLVAKYQACIQHRRANGHV